MAQVEDLSNACQPATFGFNQKDVLDETYRKAGKLDAGNFLWGFFLILVISSASLVPVSFLGVHFDPHKLNGSRFKPHQDTPRGKDMSGSLVVLLPFEHEGGNPLLRHRGREYEFNKPALLNDSSPVSAAYIAFFSDVEHEVAQVVSGHRGTIIYNLYFDPNKGVPVTRVPRDAQLEHIFTTALRTCLDTAVTQPIPQYLGFGLTRTYPLESALFDSKSLNFKGSDATVIKALNEANIEHDFFLLYRGKKDNCYCPFRVLSTAVIHGYIEPEGPYYESAFEIVACGKDSFLVWGEDSEEVAKNPRRSDWYGHYDDRKRFKSIDVKWVLSRAQNV